MKQIILLVWRIIVAIGMLAIISLTIVVFYKLYKESNYSHQNEKRRVENTYNDTYIFEYHKGAVRTKDAITGEYLSPRMTNILINRHVKDTLTVFFAGNKRGFLDIYTGKMVIPAQFDRAWIFSEGLGGVVSNGKLGFIDSKGELVIPHKFNYINHHRNGVDFLFKGGYCAVLGDNNKYGLIDKSGEWVLEPQYDNITKTLGGHRIICENGKYGVLDKSLKILLPISYDWIVVRENGFLVRQEGAQRLLALDGKTVLASVIYDEIYNLSFETGRVDSEGSATHVISDYMAYKVGDKWGIIDKKGRRLTNAIYEDVDALQNDLFRCEISDGCSILVNGKGEIVQ